MSIEYPSQGILRARKVISRSKARPTGKFPSWKMGRMMHWESIHELNAYRLLDANPAVTAFYEQPLTIRFVLDGEQHRHYPDTLVILETGERELWEIKTAADAASSEVVARTRLLQAALSDKGFQYRVVLGEDLAKQPRLSNVLTLLKYGRQPVSQLAREQVRQLLAAAHFVTWQSAIDGTLGPQGLAALSRLTLEGMLVCDVDQKIGPATHFALADLKARSLT